MEGADVDRTTEQACQLARAINSDGRTMECVADAVDASRTQGDFDDAQDAAAHIVADLNGEWGASGAMTRVSFEINAGADEQPVFTFAMLLDLTDDFDVADWPADQVEQLSEEVRGRLIGSPVDDWDWLVTARAVAPIE